LFLNNGRLEIHYSYSMNKYLVWVIELFLYLADIIALPDILEIMMDLIHWKNRKLNEQEIEIIRSVYTERLNLDTISIDNYGSFFEKRASAFVGFNTIFFNIKSTPELLIHEVCHCYQYQKHGSVYIIRALLAQHSEDGYDYGGISKLENILMNDLIYTINYEQMADIMADHYVIRNPENYNVYDDQDNIRSVYDQMAKKLLS